MKLVYQIDNVNLNYLLALVVEIKSEIGIEPVQILTDDDVAVNFSVEDWKRLNRGEISEKEYIDLHRRLQ